MENKVIIKEKTENKIVYIKLTKIPDWDTFYNKFIELACNLNKTWHDHADFIQTFPGINQEWKLDEMKDITYSVNNIPIRLTGERWTHIVENHEDMAGYYFDVLEAVNNPSMNPSKKM